MARRRRRPPAPASPPPAGASPSRRSMRGTWLAGLGVVVAIAIAGAIAWGRRPPRSDADVRARLASPARRARPQRRGGHAGHHARRSPRLLRVPRVETPHLDALARRASCSRTRPRPLPSPSRRIRRSSPASSLRITARATTAATSSTTRGRPWPSGSRPRGARRAPSSGPGCWSRAGAWPRASTSTPTASSSRNTRSSPWGPSRRRATRSWTERCSGWTPCASAASSPGSTSTTRTRRTSRRSRSPRATAGSPTWARSPTRTRSWDGSRVARDAGLMDRTIVVVVGDHGESLGDHGEDSHAYFIYGATMHVPLIVRTPWGSPAAARPRFDRRHPADGARPVGLAPQEGIDGRSLARALSIRPPPSTRWLLGDVFPPLSLRLAAPAQPARRPLHLRRRPRARAVRSREDPGRRATSSRPTASARRRCACGWRR